MEHVGRPFTKGAPPRQAGSDAATKAVVVNETVLDRVGLALPEIGATDKYAL
jgi:hypothetical protein